jgi:hypothetical protein
LGKVGFGRFDDADVGHAGAAEPGGERDPGVTATDHGDSMADGLR